MHNAPRKILKLTMWAGTGYVWLYALHLLSLAPVLGGREGVIMICLIVSAMVALSKR